jgi:hypothetical protein
MAEVKFIEKVNVRAYTLNIESGYRCQIFIESPCARISVVSEFGNWSHMFGFREFNEFITFLKTLKDKEYLASKFGEINKGRVSHDFNRFWEKAWLPFLEKVQLEE